MAINRDFSDLLRSLCDAGVRFLVVGAHAVAYYTEPRYTKDLDIWVEATPSNAERVWTALRRFGAPLAGVTPADFTNSSLVYQMGIEPNRIDIIMGIDGIGFGAAWRRRVRTTYGGVSISLLGRTDLIRNKRAAGRPQDLLDIARLKASTSRGSRRRRTT